MRRLKEAMISKLGGGESNKYKQQLKNEIEECNTKKHFVLVYITKMRIHAKPTSTSRQ